MKHYIAICALLALFLSGCASLEKHENTAKLAVTYAALKYVEQAGDASAQSARAAKIRSLVEEVRGVAKGDSVTVAALQAYVLGKLPAGLSPADRYLAHALVQAVAEELQERVGGGLLSEEQLLQVELILGWIIEAAGYVA